MSASDCDVAIVGAGPAGLVLAHLLAEENIRTCVLERRSREHVEGRIRAGVIEAPVAGFLSSIGLGERMRREGMTHGGVEIAHRGERHRIDFEALCGRGVTVYGQHELVKDAIAARLADGGDLRFDAKVTGLAGLDGGEPVVHYRDGAGHHAIGARFVIGCDGYRGPCRTAIPNAGARSYAHPFPYGWLGILAQAPPAQEELIYARHERGFALFSMRSSEITRLYIQVPAEEDIEAWPDARIWEELAVRLGADGFEPRTGPVLQKGITAMRSFVCETMQHGRLFLAGDAAHIVPPTGAKGMNLAIADVALLAPALARFFRSGEDAGLKAYQAQALRRVWATVRFSVDMTLMLHRDDDADPFTRRLREKTLEETLADPRSLAERYTGLPLAA